MDYLIRVYHNGRVFESFARDYASAVVMAEGVERMGMAAIVWRGATIMRQTAPPNA